MRPDGIRGPFLAGFSLRDSPDFDDWRATRAVALERAVAQLLDRVADAKEVEGDTDGAVAAARRRLDLDPLDEAAHRRLMRIYPLGVRAGAVRQYRACVAVLERELGVSPLPETSTLYEAIRDAAPGSGCFAGPTRRAAGAPVAATPGSLPLVGRDASWLGCLPNTDPRRPDGRVAAVVGEAGIGKSRLVEALRASVDTAGGRASQSGRMRRKGIAYGSIIELLREGLASLAGGASACAAGDAHRARATDTAATRARTSR